MPTNNAWNSQNPAQVARGGTGNNTLADHSLLVGNNINAINTIAPHITTGIPLISKGVGANPDYGTAVIAGGGTGRISTIEYSVLCGGTLSQNPLQSVASVGAVGQVLTSNGAGLLPTWQAYGGGGGIGAYSFYADVYTPPVPLYTGDGADIRIQFDRASCDPSGVWDNVNYQFTAPINGVYWFNMAQWYIWIPPSVVWNENIRFEWRLHTPLATYYSYYQNKRPNTWQMIVETLCILNAGDIVYGSYMVSNAGGKYFRASQNYAQIFGCLVKSL